MGVIATNSDLQPGSKVKLPSQRRSMSRTATRALDVLELFGQQRRPLRAIEIAGSLGLQGSTTDQLLKTMVDSTHLVFDAARKTYQPSHHLVGFTSWIADTYGTDERVDRLMADLHERSGLSASLSTPNDLFMQIIEITMPASRDTERGLKVSMFASAIGSAHLSTLADDDIIRFARRACVAEREIAAIPSLIAQIRDKGFADAPGMKARLWAVAVPLPAGCLPFAAVLAFAGPTEDLLPYRGTLAQMLRDSIAHHL